MWFENKPSGQSLDKATRSSLGFTLLEMVMVLTIVGLMTVAVGSGIVYGVKIYKATQGANAVMPQVVTALNVLRHRVMKEGVSGVKGQVTLNRGVLSVEGSPILHHVASFDLKENVPVYGGGQITQITIQLQPDVIGGKHTWIVEVAND